MIEATRYYKKLDERGSARRHHFRKFQVRKFGLPKRQPERRVARSQLDADFMAAKVELIRLRVAEKKRELVPLEYMRAVEDKAIGVVRTAMSGMAARCAGNDLQLRRKIDQVVYEARAQLAAISSNSPMKLMSRH